MAPLASRNSAARIGHNPPPARLRSATTGSNFSLYTPFFYISVYPLMQTISKRLIFSSVYFSKASIILCPRTRWLQNAGEKWDVSRNRWNRWLNSLSCGAMRNHHCGIGSVWYCRGCVRETHDAGISCRTKWWLHCTVEIVSFFFVKWHPIFDLMPATDMRCTRPQSF